MTTYLITSLWTVKKGNSVSALGVGGNSLWNKITVANTLKWSSGLVCLATYIKKRKTNDVDNIMRYESPENTEFLRKR